MSRRVAKRPGEGRAQRGGRPFLLALAVVAVGCDQVLLQVDRVTEMVGGSRAAAGRPKLDCNARYDTASPRGCLTGELICGDVVQGTTVGGESNFDDAFYAGAFCFPPGERHSASERVYRFSAPQDTQVTVTLDSPCADLDLAVVAWKYEGTCPVAQSPIAECEGETSPGGGSVVIQVFNPRDYIVAVDGKDGVTGPYQLSVSCTPLAR
jgi:hypothetical protein